MAISALLTASMLQPISASSTLISSQKAQSSLQPLEEAVASSTSSSAQLADDTYTPSSQSTQSSMGQSAQTPLQVPWTTPRYFKR